MCAIGFIATIYTTDAAASTLWYRQRHRALWIVIHTTGASDRGVVDLAQPGSDFSFLVEIDRP